MIDGFKILYNNPTNWTKSHLDFSQINNARNPTKNPFQYCKYKGLFLSITHTEKQDFRNVRGSLPNYYNDEKGNAFDFGFNELISSVKQLQKDLEINPELAYLQGFEFGININLPFPVKNILDACKSYNGTPFTTQIGTEKKPFRGVEVEKQQYKIKLYDKGLQTGDFNVNLCRFEIKVKKMLWIKNKNLNIKTLADLQLKSVWTELSKILLEIWQNIVFVDNNLNYKEMKPIEQKKYLRFLDINYWETLNRNQSYKARKYLENLTNSYQKFDLQKYCFDLINDKCKILSTENSDNLTTISQPQKHTNWRQINHYDKGVNNKLKRDLEALINRTGNKSKKNKIIISSKINKCVCCRTSLVNKKSTAKYCGTICKNRSNGKKRTQKNRNRINSEIKGLIKIIPKINKINLSEIAVFYKHNNENKIFLNQNIIHELEINSISKINLNYQNTFYVFTTVRAKKLIKQILKTLN